MEVITNTVAYYLRRAGYSFDKLSHILYHEPPLTGFCVFTLLSYWMLVKSIVEQSQLVDGWGYLDSIMLTHEQVLHRHGLRPLRMSAREYERDTPL